MPGKSSAVESHPKARGLFKRKELLRVGLICKGVGFFSPTFPRAIQRFCSGIKTLVFKDLVVDNLSRMLKVLGLIPREKRGGKEEGRKKERKEGEGGRKGGGQVLARNCQTEQKCGWP